VIDWLIALMPMRVFLAGVALIAIAVGLLILLQTGPLSAGL
jgi:hypothetical protein